MLAAQAIKASMAIFDFLALDLLAEIFRGASDHQAGNENGDDGEQEHSVEAGSDAAKNDLSRLNIEQRHQAAKRSIAVVHAVDAAVAGIGCGHGPKRRRGNPKADFLAFHVAAGLRCGRCRLHAQSGKIRIACLLRRIADEDACQEQKAHRRKYGPTLTRVLHHFPEGINQPGRYQEDEQGLKKIGKRRRILERMRGIGVKEPSAICAQLLDRNLGRGRTLRDGLSFALDGRCRRIPMKVLHHALRAEEQRSDERKRQQDINRSPHKVDPEVADRILTAAAQIP